MLALTYLQRKCRLYKVYVNLYRNFYLLLALVWSDFLGIRAVFPHKDLNYIWFFIILRAESRLLFFFKKEKLPSTVNDLLFKSKLYTKRYKCKYLFTINVVPQGTVPTSYVLGYYIMLYCLSSHTSHCIIFISSYLHNEWKDNERQRYIGFTQPKKQVDSKYSALERKHTWPTNPFVGQRTMHLWSD